MKTTIRKGIRKDLPSVLKLIKELADFENAKDQVTITLEDLEKDGFGEKEKDGFAEKDKEGFGEKENKEGFCGEGEGRI